MIQNKLHRTFGLRRWVPAALLLVLFALEGCAKRTEFEEKSALEGGVDIALEWEQTALPTPLTFAFYRVAEKGTLYKEYEGTAEGFKGMLPVGEYQMIAYDKNALKVQYRNMNSYETAEVHAVEIVKSSKADENMQIDEPSAVYSVGTVVGMATLQVEVDKTLTAKAQPLNRTRSVVLHFEIKNGIDITTISGTIDGVSPSVLLSTGRSSNLSSQLAFYVDRAVDNSFQVSVSLFDFIAADAGATEVNTIDVTLTGSDGATHDMKLDLTGTIRDIVHANGGVIPIEIPIKIEITMTDLENITATVHPWVSGSGSSDVVD